MGNRFMDQYSLLHVATGIVAYFWNISLLNWTLIHLLFEIVENQPTGMMFINKYMKKSWPGGKPNSDHLINSMGDQLFAMIGWAMAYYLDEMGKKYNWYNISTVAN